MKINEIITESYQPPELEVGDKILKGKFKNSPAEIKGFKKDKHNQPVLKTNKGDVQLFKPRIVKLEDDSLNEGSQNNLTTIIQSFVASPEGQKYKEHDCKTVTRAFVAWATRNKIPATVVTLAPPSADFITKNPRYKGKSGQGDGHIMPIVNGNAIDFTVRQFGINRRFENPLVTPIKSMRAVYGKFGYFTDKPEWFLGGKSHWIGRLTSIPREIFNQNFSDELLEQVVAEDREYIRGGKYQVNLNGVILSVSIDGQTVDVRALDPESKEELGYVVFDRDGDTLVADGLAVDERSRGRGIAKTMYNHVKERGFTVRRSYDQTSDGKSFWDKNKGEEGNLWEQGVA